MEEIGLIAGDVIEIEERWSSNDVQRGGAVSAALSSSSTDPPIHKDAMVGFEDYALDLKSQLCGEPSKKLQIIPICGMGGIGKTTLAKNVYYDPLIMERFDIRVWVTISQDYSAKRILSNLVESLNIVKKGVEEEKKSDEVLVHQFLMGRRYLAVMDDIWSSEAWDFVRSLFHDDGNGSRIVLTTRLYHVASYPDPSSKLYEMGLLNVDQSWNLLKQKVFADEDCPSELENIAREIAISCKGLPLAIVVIAGLLSTVSQNRAPWEEIAENVKSADTAEQGQIEGILSLSYVHLPQYLRPCFLYMASFPEDEEIRVSKLVRLWIAEGFVKSPIDSESFEKAAEELLEELVKRNLVLVTKRKCDGGIKSCSLHDMMRDLCIRKSHESKFSFNLMDRHIEKEHFLGSIENHRRLNVGSSYLSYLSSCDGSAIHSIRCSTTKPCKVKPDFLESVRLLRVLDGESVDVECSSFPDHLYELFHLKYLDIRYSQDTPEALLRFRNLQTLIIRKEKLIHFHIVLDLWLSWCTPQLRHVYYYGTILFTPPKETEYSLESLQTLSYVSHWSCTERILKLIPNLKKLKVDSSACIDGVPARLDHLAHLRRLENLEIYAGRWVQSRPKCYNFSFPSMLKKLTLRALEFPWNDMIAASSLPNLQVLKLRRCTCVGGTWETTEGGFLALEYLLIEDASNFKDWTTESSHFPSLKRLLLHSCWELDEIPNDIGEISTLELIQLKGNGKMSLVESAEQIKNEQEDLGNDTLQVLFIAKSSQHERFDTDKTHHLDLVEVK